MEANVSSIIGQRPITVPLKCAVVVLCKRGGVRWGVGLGVGWGVWGVLATWGTMPGGLSAAVQYTQTQVLIHYAMAHPHTMQPPAQ